MIEEVIYISAFNVKLDGTIEVRKTTDVTKDGAVIASSYWRGVLAVNDPSADEVLGTEGYFRTLASDAWAMVPAPASPVSPAPEVEVVAAELPTEAEVVTPEPSTEAEVVTPEPSTEEEGVAAELPTE